MNTDMFAMVNHNHNRKASRKRRKARFDMGDILLVTAPIVCMLLMQIVEWVL